MALQRDDPSRMTRRLHPSSSLSSVLTRHPWALALIFGLSCGAHGCKKRSSDGGDDLGPAQLVFLDAQNSSGETFEPDAAELTVSCDQFLTFRFGPQEDAQGLLDNWIMRPPGLCTTQLQCGHIRLEILDREGEVLLAERSASVNVVVDLSTIDLDRVASANATLREGQSSDPFLQDGEPVAATWDFEVSQGECPPGNLGGTGMGGAGPVVDPMLGGGAGMGGTSPQG